MIVDKSFSSTAIFKQAFAFIIFLCCDKHVMCIFSLNIGQGGFTESGLNVKSDTVAR